MPPTVSQNQPVVTRFAPSPTGYLHIGGARTALFSWLYARGRGGKFLLRIEDTDRARHTEEAVEAIVTGLKWLGLDWDADPVSQFEQRDRHVEVAELLLSSQAAYRCYLTPDELEAARENAKTQKTRFESPWRDKSPEEAPADAPYTIRFKAPRDGNTIVNDAVQGDVSFPNAALDDLIIVRSDGNPTYNLAVVVDDHDMGITHVIRGDDHLNNAARQTQIYQALGWTVPVFAHVPLIHGQDGSKLSKRHGALGVEAYRDDGILPGGLANYLLRLGWAHGDEEIIPTEKAKTLFDLPGINKAPARLDLEKLSHINAHYVAELNDHEFVNAVMPFLKAAGIALDEETTTRLERSAPFLKSRCAKLSDIVTASAYLFLSRPISVTGKAAKPLKKEGALDILREASKLLETDDLWASATSLDNALQSFVTERNISFGVVGPPMRAALTAGHPSPSLGEVLYGLGKSEALARIAEKTA